jgi:DMSO/TMAO reductase YedYZ molybdopterin-dependent catalytic subunit
MLAVMGGLRYFLGFLTIPELMLNTILNLMGGRAFSDALDRLFYAGRPLLFATILEGALLLGALLGLLYASISRSDPFTGARPTIFTVPLGGILYGLLIGILLNLVFLPLVGQPIFASTPSGLYMSSPLPLWLGLILLALIYGLVLQLLLPSPSPAVLAAEPDHESRRHFLRIAGGTLLALFGGSLFTLAGTIINQGGLTSPVDNRNLDLSDTTPSDTPTPPAVAQSLPPTSTRPAPPTQPPPTVTARPAEPEPTVTADLVAEAPPPTNTPEPLPTDTVPPPPPTDTAVPPPPTSTPPPPIKVSELTPVPSFYHVSKNFVDPSPSSQGWSLSIKGLVQNPYSLTYKELTSMRSIAVVVGMMCISNPIGGGLIGNSTWKGVRLADLINKAKPKKGVVDIAMTALDGYTDSIPYQKALDTDVVLAWEMGGAPLTPDHGFPARLLVPGIYGMKHVKWLTTIELVNYDFKGFWQQPDQGWSDPAPVRTMSKIDYPAAGTLKLQPQTISGIAFAGDRSISKVEISTDAGKTWAEAYIKPKLSDTAWVVWAYNWSPPKPGKYTVMVRATDGHGTLQLSKRTDPYPNGANGWHSVVYTVK